jgi:hypothetical protein
VQPALYAAIAVCGVIVYRRNYISFRYTLTDRMFAIERIAGNREETLTAVPLRDIQAILHEQELTGSKWRVYNASKSTRSKSITIFVKEKKMETAWRISPSDYFLQKLTAQWQLALSQKE